MSQSSDLWVKPTIDTASDEGNNPSENLSQTSLITLLCDSLAVLWKDWPRNMRCTILDINNNRFSFNGICPHCESFSVFMIAGSPHAEHVTPDASEILFCAVMRCQACLLFILGIAVRRGNAIEYVEHYPMGKPDDAVPKEVTAADSVIALDFAESLRCLWVKSYKASVAMCRRSVEATCKQQGAKGRDLEKKIDDLAAQGKITEPLRQMAHAVRLSANRGLHGKKKAHAVAVVADAAEVVSEQEPVEMDDLDTFGEDEAKAMIEFTKELFHHIYVMPALLEKYKAKPKSEASEGTI